MIKSSKLKVILSGYGTLLIAEVMCFILLIFLPVLSHIGIIINIIYGFCSLSIYVALFSDKAYKIGRSDYLAEKRGEKTFGYGFIFIFSLLMMLPSYIMAFLSVLSKLNVIGNFLPLYKFLNAFFFPFIDLSAHNASIHNATTTTFVLMFTLPLLLLAGSLIFYNAGVKNLNVTEEIVYKK